MHVHNHTVLLALNYVQKSSLPVYDVRSAVHDVTCVLLHDKRTKIKNMNLDPELDMDWVGSSRVRSGRVGQDIGRIT